MTDLALAFLILVTIFGSMLGVTMLGTYAYYLVKERRG